MFVRPTEVLVFWTRRAGAAMLAVLAFAGPARAQTTQSILTSPTSGITIQVTNSYSGVPSRGFLPLRISIVNSSNSNGQWDVETQALDDTSIDRHFGAQARCVVPAHQTRVFEVLAPLPDSQPGSPPRVNVHVAGPGVSSSDVAFFSNVLQPPMTALRMVAPGGPTSFSRAPGVSSVGSFTANVTIVGSGVTTQVTNTELPNGNKRTEVLVTRPDGSTRTTTTETDPSGRVVDHSVSDTPGRILPSTNTTFTKDPLTGATITTTVTKNADGSTTTVTHTPTPVGTDVVTETTDASGLNNSTTHELLLSAQTMQQAIPGSPLISSPGNANLLAGMPTIGSSISINGGGSSTAPSAPSAGDLNLQGRLFITPAAPVNLGTMPPPPPPSPAPPPSPPPAPPAPSSPSRGFRSSRSGFPPSGRGGFRGSPGRFRSPGPPIFIGLSTTLAHDKGDKIRDFYLNTYARPLQQTALDPNGMSADWRAYLGFDLIFYTAADWLATPPEARTALIQWVAGGGELRLVANQDGGLDLPPRNGERYGAGAIELFNEDELNNYDYTVEPSDYRQHLLFSLIYHPVAANGLPAAGVDYYVPEGMEQRQFSISENTLVRLIGFDPYANPNAAPSLADVMQAENMLKNFFSSYSGIAFPDGGDIHLDADAKRLIVINTPGNLDSLAATLARYGEAGVNLPATSANSPEMNKLAKIFIPALNIQQQMPLNAFVQTLNNLAVSFDPEGKGVKLQLVVPEGEPMPLLTMPNLNNLSVADLLSLACLKTGYHIVPEGGAITLRKAAASTSAAQDTAKLAPPNFMDQMPHLNNQYILVAIVIICFGLLAGPINLFVFCRGSRRPHLLWVTPLLAVLASIAIMGFILLAEGIGGRGIYYRITQLDPDGKFAVESEVESSVTGVLTHHDFQLPESAWLLDYDQANGMNAPWVRGSFVQSGAHYTGDWFDSRHEQLLFARAVTPSRAALRADPAVNGNPPVLHSDFNGLMVNVYYMDGDGHYWKADRITDGQPTRLQPATEDEFKTAWDENMRTAPALLQGYLRKITPLPGTFFALGSGDASVLEPKFAGLRWSRFRHLVTGPVEQSPQST